MYNFAGQTARIVSGVARSGDIRFGKWYRKAARTGLAKALAGRAAGSLPKDPKMPAIVRRLQSAM